MPLHANILVQYSLTTLPPMNRMSLFLLPCMHDKENDIKDQSTTYTIYNISPACLICILAMLRDGQLEVCSGGSGCAGFHGFIRG